MFLFIVGLMCGGFCAGAIALILIEVHEFYDRPERFPSRQVHPH